MSRITEPATLITDWLLGILGFACAYGLYNVFTKTNSFALLVWVAMFCAVSISACIGGIYHGFHTHMHVRTSARLWKITVYIAVLGNALLAGASALSFLSGTLFFVFLAGVFLKFIYVSVVLSRTDSFHIVIYDALVSMGIMLALYSIYASSAVFVLMVLSIGISLLAGVVQFFLLSLSRHFNHNDMFHVIQMVAWVFMYKALLEQFI